MAYIILCVCISICSIVWSVRYEPFGSTSYFSIGPSVRSSLTRFPNQRSKEKKFIYIFSPTKEQNLTDKNFFFFFVFNASKGPFFIPSSYLLKGLNEIKMTLKGIGGGKERIAQQSSSSSSKGSLSYGDIFRANEIFFPTRNFEIKMKMKGKNQKLFVLLPFLEKRLKRKTCFFSSLLIVEYYLSALRMLPNRPKRPEDLLSKCIRDDRR